MKYSILICFKYLLSYLCIKCMLFLDAKAVKAILPKTLMVHFCHHVYHFFKRVELSHEISILYSHCCTFHHFGSTYSHANVRVITFYTFILQWMCPIPPQSKCNHCIREVKSWCRCAALHYLSDDILFNIEKTCVGTNLCIKILRCQLFI